MMMVWQFFLWAIAMVCLSSYVLTHLVFIDDKRLFFGALTGKGSAVLELTSMIN